MNAWATAFGNGLPAAMMEDSLRPVAERYLSQHFAPRTQRYFKRKRLTALGLPGDRNWALSEVRTGQELEARRLGITRHTRAQPSRLP